MSRGVILVNIDDPFLRQVGRRVAEQMGVDSVFTASPEAMMEHLNAPIVDSRLLYRARDVRRGFPNVVPAAIGRRELLALLECERHFMTVTDRSSHTAISVKERKRLFRELVRYFMGFLNERKSAGTIFFESTPHMGWDLVLYFVARLMNRQTLILSRTLLPDRVLLIEDFTKPPPLHDEPLEFDPEIEAAAWAPSTWSAASDMRNKDALDGKGAKSWKARLLEPIRLAKLANRPPRFISAVAASGPKTPLEIEALRRAHARWAARLRSAYDSHVSAMPDGPYVYMALHFQPERTTQPEGLEFEDQLLALDLLSRAIPKSWSIVIKEHPRQFELTPLPLRLRHARTPEDYIEMAAIPNLHFAALDTPGGQLLAQCALAATVTGSTGWEALRIGKPAVVFGPCWYAGCEGVALVSNLEDAYAGIARLSLKTRADIVSDLKRFLSRLQPLLIKSTTAEGYARGSSIPYEQLVDGLARAIEMRSRPRVNEEVLS